MTSDWRALRIERGALPDVIEYERAVWGKVHGARSDFRWIALSADFGATPGLPDQLNLGGEDAPVQFQAWRNLGDRCYAVSGYASRASDAAGRSGFLEKQILEWRRPPDVPAAIGALLLLPHAAAQDDTIWWNRYAGHAWSQPETYLPIASPHHEPLPLDEQRLTAAIERGCEIVRESVGVEALAQLYDQLLSRERPAFLRLRQPLPAEALAALLLPLSRDYADRISLAGWIPANRPSYGDLAYRWDVIVGPSPSTQAAMQPKARQLAEELLAGEPRKEREAVISAVSAAPAIVIAKRATSVLARPGLELDLSQPSTDASPLIHELHAFARSVDRRWLDPDRLNSRLPGNDRNVIVIREWIKEVAAQRPDFANEDQWRVKVDLLRSAAVLLAPEMLATFDTPGADSRVPALLFATLLEKQYDLDRFAERTGEQLKKLMIQSLTCHGAKRFAQRIRSWLDEWRNPRRQISALIDDVLKTYPPQPRRPA